jgi:hypothetical protein
MCCSAAGGAECRANRRDEELRADPRFHSHSRGAGRCDAATRFPTPGYTARRWKKQRREAAEETLACLRRRRLEFALRVDETPEIFRKWIRIVIRIVRHSTTLFA